MAVRMIKKSWWVDLSFAHARYRKRSPENSKVGAQAYEAVLRRKLANGESIDGVVQKASQEQTFAKFARRWFNEYIVLNTKPSTQYSRKCILVPSLIPFFGKMQVSQIAMSDIEKYKAKLHKKGLANKTINEHLMVLVNCMSAAYKWLQLEGAPPEITWLKCPPPKIDYLSFDESELLLSNAEGVIREMILTALKTGMRLGEIIGLQWSSIDWENRLIGVRHSWSPCAKELGSPKSNHERHIDMTADLYAALLKRKRSTGFVFMNASGEHFNHYCLGTKLSGICKKAGLRRITWHTLRHTFASHLVMRGAPLPVVQKLMGHASIEMTMRYAHLASSTMRTAIDLLNPKWALPVGFGQPAVNQWLEAQARKDSEKSPMSENTMIIKLEI